MQIRDLLHTGEKVPYSTRSYSHTPGKVSVLGKSHF